jgi:hypothetical protein
MRAMKRALLVTAILAASTQAASAGTYLGLGIGPGANVGGTDGHVDEGGRSMRLLGGYKLSVLSGRLAIEGALSFQGLTFKDNGGPEYDGRQLGVYGKYNHPLGSDFEVFGKLGVHRTWFSSEVDAYAVAGQGFLVGVGAEYRLTAILASASVWVDYTHHMATLDGDRYSWDAGVGMWMLGFSIGL